MKYDQYEKGFSDMQEEISEFAVASIGMKKNLKNPSFHLLFSVKKLN